MKNKTIFALTDYRGNFESKYDKIPYNSGMDKKLLEKYFSAFDFEIVFIPLSEVINHSNTFWGNKIVIYTSSEDTEYYYKNFIEDIVYYLELSNAKVIPPFKYLRANIIISVKTISGPETFPSKFSLLKKSFINSNPFF